MDTSGIILAAKTPAILLASLAAAESGRIRKTYRLIAGRPEASNEAERGVPGSTPRSLGLGTLEARLSIESRFRPYGPKGARVACIEPGPEGSSDPVYITVLRRIEKDSRGAFVLEAEIGRGYRHQIRAHTAWTGFPIHGDRIYGGMAAPRLMLEACGIEVDPGNGKAFRFDLYA